MAKGNGGQSMNEGQYQNFMADNVAHQQTAQLNQHAYGRGVGIPSNMAMQRQQMIEQQAGKPLSPQAQAYFAQAAVVCQICGNGGVGESAEITPEQQVWERKWSVHHTCADAVWNQLDRRSGILSERR